MMAGGVSYAALKSCGRVRRDRYWKTVESPPPRIAEFLTPSPCAGPRASAVLGLDCHGRRLQRPRTLELVMSPSLEAPVAYR